MPKVEIHEDGGAPAGEGAALSPSAQLIKDALRAETITDGKGRRILLRKPGVLTQYRIVESVGPELAANLTYMNMVNPLTWVAEIDGDPIALPKSKLQIEALITRLDDEGLEAVMTWFADKAEAVAGAAEQKAQLKNS